MDESPRLVIFDCDGVLVDSEIIACRVLSSELNALGLPLTPKDCLDRFTGITMAAVMARIEAMLGGPLPEDFEETLRRKDFEAFETELRPVPGVIDMLPRLTVPRCIASSGAIAKMQLTLTATGLLPHFAPHLFSAQMVERGKPAPDLFLYAAARMGAEPSACVVIEDSAAGIEAALAAGMGVLGFAGGSHGGAAYAAMLSAAGAPAVFSDMSGLPALLERRGGSD
jgi:HAD superfamily hydrolase (TIGR01509 family)